MFVNSSEAVAILIYMPADLDLEDQWPILLNAIYSKRDEVEVSFPVASLKDLIRELPSDKTLIELRRRIAFEILELDYPDDVPLSDAQIAGITKVKAKVEEGERLERERLEAEQVEQRLEAERVEQDRLHAEKLEQLKQERLEQELEQERLEEPLDDLTPILEVEEGYGESKESAGKDTYESAGKDTQAGS